MLSTFHRQQEYRKKGDKWVAKFFWTLHYTQSLTSDFKLYPWYGQSWFHIPDLPCIGIEKTYFKWHQPLPKSWSSMSRTNTHHGRFRRTWNWIDNWLKKIQLRLSIFSSLGWFWARRWWVAITQTGTRLSSPNTSYTQGGDGPEHPHPHLHTISK